MSSQEACPPHCARQRRLNVLARRERRAAAQLAFLAPRRPVHKACPLQAAEQLILPLEVGWRNKRLVAVPPNFVEHRLCVLFL